MRKIVYLTLLTCCIFLIGYIFWIQEIKFSLPTPIPKSYSQIKVGSKVSDEIFKEVSMDKPLLIHFFQKTCPCSRFNIKEVKRINKKYANQVNFIMVLESDNDNSVKEFHDKYKLNIPVFYDFDGHISDHFGVYSSPQVVIIQPDSTIYYRGNYNKARYCTTKKSAYADLALNALIKGNEIPKFEPKATIAYGCSLPSDSTKETNIIELFINK